MLKIKTPERRQRRRFHVHIINFEHISNIFLVFLLLLFEQMNVSEAATRGVLLEKVLLEISQNSQA